MVNVVNPGFISCQFVNAGLQRIVELFKEPFDPTKAGDVQTLVTSAGEVLRLLSKVVEHFRENALVHAFAKFESEIERAVIDAIEDSQGNESGPRSSRPISISAEPSLRLEDGSPLDLTQASRSIYIGMCTVWPLLLFRSSSSTSILTWHA